MCTCMFMTDKEATDERAIIRMNCVTAGQPVPRGKFLARVLIEDPTNPETNGVWYATTRYDYHWALTGNPDLAHPMSQGDDDCFRSVQEETENFIHSLILHGITAFEKVELLKRGPCPLPGVMEVVATIVVG